MSNLVLNRALVLLAIFPLFLTGCIGGGGGGGTPKLQLSTNSISLSLDAGFGNTSAQVVITLPKDTNSLLAGYTSSQTQPTWVNYSFDPFSIGDTTANFNVGVNATGLTADTYTDYIYIEARDTRGSVLARGAVSVTFTVTDPLIISLNRLDFQKQHSSP